METLKETKKLADLLTTMYANITSLDLSFNEIQDDGAIAIGDSLKSHKALKELKLRECGITAKGAKALAGALSVNGVITFMDVSNNSIGDEGMRTIGKALLGTRTSKLGSLKCDAFELPVGATSLDLRGKRPIGSAAATLLAGVVKHNAVLKTVDVSHNSQIEGEAAQQLAAAALGSASLEMLSKVPIKEIREDKHTELNLNRKGLGSTEAIVLAKLLKGSGVLTDLNLKNNRIGPDGAKALARSLKVNAVLKSCDVRFNGLDEAAKNELRDAVKGREGFELLI